MPLFGYNYTKPGKGVDPNAPKKECVFAVLGALGRSFFKICASEYFIFLYNFADRYLCLMHLLRRLASLDRSNRNCHIFPDRYLWHCSIDRPVGINILPLLIISLLLYGPFTADLTYILRNYAREEHAFISDFFQKA